MSNDAQDLVTTAEAAQIAGRSVATINRWVTAGLLQPAVKMPGLRGAHLFTRTDLDRLIAARTFKRTA